MFWNQGDSKGALTPKNSKSIKFTMRGGFFTFWAILAHNVTAQKYLRFEILIASFKYIRTVNPKKTKLVLSIFGRIYDAPICSWFYLTFKLLLLIL